MRLWLLQSLLTERDYFLIILNSTLIISSCHLPIGCSFIFYMCLLLLSNQIALKLHLISVVTDTTPIERSIDHSTSSGASVEEGSSSHCCLRMLVSCDLLWTDRADMIDEIFRHLFILVLCIILDERGPFIALLLLLQLVGGQLLLLVPLLLLLLF